jgi:hypothetical protein
MKRQTTLAMMLVPITLSIKLPRDLLLLCQACIHLTQLLNLPLQVSNRQNLNFNNCFLVFSSHADIEVIQLQDSMNAVLASKWSDKTAGGCHLYDKEFE